MIVVKSKRCSEKNILKEYPDAEIIDVTSNAEGDFVRLSPFYPHGGIPVPFSPGWTAMSVESIWQGLKVFESTGTDVSLFKNNTMKNLKRTVRKYGPIKGHRKGVGGSELLGYVTARQLIYVPAYKWMLENRAKSVVDRIRELAKTGTVVLLDYDTNPVVEDPSSPLSHASLIKAYIEGSYPVCEGTDAARMQKPEDVKCDFNIGQRVRHPKFGDGTVKAIEGERITVTFEGGDKLLVLRLAKLEAI